MADIREINPKDSFSEVVNRARDKGLAEVVVVGWTKDGESLVIESNCGRHMELHWLLSSALNALLEDCKL